MESRRPSEALAGVVERSPAAAFSAGPSAAPMEESPTVQVIVLRKALAEERARTTALRDELDRARISLLAAQGRADRMAREREQWADRLRLLAALVADELDAPQTPVLQAVGA